MTSEEREFLEWDSAEERYLIEDVSGSPLSVSQVESSLREQGFEESSSDEWMFSLRSRNVEAVYSDEEDYLEIDFNGKELSNMREIETYHSLSLGHTEYADSLKFIYYKEVENNTIPY